MLGFFRNNDGGHLFDDDDDSDDYDYDVVDDDAHLVGFFEKAYDENVDDNDDYDNDKDDGVQPVGWSVSLRRWGRCRPPGAGVARPRLREKSY